MSRLFSILLYASIGYALGLAFGRPGFGLVVGTLVALLVPVGRLLRSSLATFFMALFLVVLIFPPFAAIIGLLLIIPLLLSWNLFSPGDADTNRDRWFDLFGGSNPNELMVRLMAGLVQVSPDSNEERTQAIRNFIMRNNPGVSSQFLWKTYRDALDDPIDEKDVARSIADVATTTQQTFCLQVLTEIGTLGGELTDEQEEYIRGVASEFYLDEDAVESILDGANSATGGRGRRNRAGRGRNRRQRRRRRGTGRSRNGSLRDAYETLDLSPSASREKVKEAYQEKVKKHHPDRHRSGDDQSVEEAEEKMAEINQAYQRIKEQW